MKLTTFLAQEFEILLETGLEWLFGFPFSVDITEKQGSFFVKVDYGRYVMQDQCLVADIEVSAKDLGEFVRWVYSQESNVLMESEIDDLLYELQAKIKGTWDWNV